MTSRPKDTVTTLPTAASNPPARAKSSKAGEGPGHSDIFDRLQAGEETDLVGLLAYGLYQRRKRSWMRAFQAEFGRHPSQAERNSYSYGYREESIASLREEAEGIMAAYAQAAINQRSREMQAEAIGAETRSVLEHINARMATLGSYWHHIVGHLIGFTILAGIAASVALLIIFEPTLEKVFNLVAGSAQNKSH